MKKFSCIELFSGAGGLAVGLEQAGCEHKAFVEWNAEACRTLRSNFDPTLVFEGDVRDFPFSRFAGTDIVAGGPPCQPFSVAGKAKGETDKRDMFPAAIAAIRTVRPKAFIFENVKGLLRGSFADYFNYILLLLRQPDAQLPSTDWRENLKHLQALASNDGEDTLRYNVSYKLVNAADYGVPQKRERVFIVGFRSDLNVRWDFPNATHSEDALLWDKYVDGAYWERHGVTPAPDDRLRTRLLERYGMWHPAAQPWLTVRDALSGLGAPDGKDGHTLRTGAREYPGHTGSPMDEPSKTIKAGAHGVPGGENMLKYPDGTVRYYSVAEAKRIQTFPDAYKVSGAWTEAMRQMGNAVPVRLARIVGTSVLQALATA